MDALTNDLLAYFAVIVAVSIAYSKAFGGTQESITQAVIDAGSIRSRYRRVTNLAVGVSIGLLIAGAAAIKLHSVDILPIGLFAGLMSSVEAAKAHETPSAPPPTKPASEGGTEPPAIIAK